MRNIWQINNQIEPNNTTEGPNDGELDNIIYANYTINLGARQIIVKIGYCSDDCSNQYPIGIDGHYYYCGKHGMYEWQNENIDSEDFEKRVEIQNLKGPKEVTISIPYRHIASGNQRTPDLFNFTLDYVIQE